MAQIEFRTSSELLADETHVVHVEGELDMDTAPEFEQALELNSGPSGRVVVDLSACTFIDSSGLKVLLDADRRLGRGALVIVVTGPVQMVFEVSGLDHHLTLRPSLESALNGAAR